jgi:hypothetical protein
VETSSTAESKQQGAKRERILFIYLENRDYPVTDAHRGAGVTVKTWCDRRFG